MNDPSGVLARIGAALHAGDRDAVLSCFAANATVNVLSGEDQITMTGARIGDAVDTLLAGFDDLKLTPASLRVMTARVVQETVVSGDHVGFFADAEPTGRRVCVNVRLSATGGADSTLSSLSVEVDTRALFAQIAEDNDAIGATGRLTAIARERHDGALYITDETKPRPAPGAVVSRALSGHPHARHRWAAALAVAAALLTAFFAWRGMTTAGEGAQTATAGKLTAKTATPTARKAPVAPVAGKVPVAGPALPVIAKSNPRAVPKVQAGKQVVLNSDVLFAFDSAALTPAATAAVTRLARQVRSANVSGTIQINGYTDDLGGIAYDIALSQTRALAVARVLQRTLVGRNVTLVPQGFGHANPVTPNTSDAGRARNRRVTIVLPTVR